MCVRTRREKETIDVPQGSYQIESGRGFVLRNFYGRKRLCACVCIIIV